MRALFPPAMGPENKESYLHHTRTSYLHLPPVEGTVLRNEDSVVFKDCSFLLMLHTLS
jgi:hypothetical protein